MAVKITVFTPAYNRAHLLGKLYESLKKQSFKDFEWLVVDDGSTDNTEELISQFIDEEIVDITYHRQENGGKHRAINKGVDIAEGLLFFIVDSDDYLTENALETIAKNWDAITDKSKYCGVSGLRGFTTNKVIGTCHKDYIIDCSILDYRYKYGIKGDKAEAFVTEILRNNKFPEIPGENFIGEAIVWNCLGSKYLMRWVNEIIYICKYLDDGLTKSFTRLRIKNYQGTLLLYSSNLKYDIPFKYRLRNIINYYRFLFHSGLDKSGHVLEINVFANLVGIIGGGIMFLYDRNRLKLE